MWLHVATAVFLVTMALGIGVRAGLVSTRTFAWVHHVLFFAVVATALVAVGAGLLTRDLDVVPLAGALAVYVVLPRFSGGSTRHSVAAVVALGCYVCAYALRLT